jgi:hypothetical protein
MIEAEMIQHELQISAVGFEIDVEDVTQDRNAACHRIEAHIDEHLEERLLRHAETARLVDNEEADRSGAKVADAGDKAKN